MLGLAIWTTARGRGRLLLAIAAATFVALFAALISYAIIDLGSSRLFALLDILTWNQNALGEHTSAGVRVLVYLNTLELIADHPFGVGLGAWADHVSHSYGLDYPHNLFLEVWSESGLILGSLALVPFTIALVLPGPPALRAITLFCFLAQQVSGDLLDARYLLTFSVLHCWVCGCLASTDRPTATAIKVAGWRTDRLKPA